MTDANRDDESSVDPETLADRVLDGELAMYELEGHADADTAARARRLVVERETGVELAAAGEYVFDAAQVSESNIENLTGGTQLPMGVAGPVEIGRAHV